MATPVGFPFDTEPANILGAKTVVPLIVVLLPSHSVIQVGKFSIFPSAPFLPFKTLDQLKVFLNETPSTVIGIVNEPVIAKEVPAFATIVIVVPLLLNVNPVTVGKVPIVGVTAVVPLKANTCVVFVMLLAILPVESALNVSVSLVNTTV